MRYLRSVSVVLLLVGVALLAAGVLLPRPTWTLIGLLLAWAGIVKVVVVHLWRGLSAPDRAPATVREDD